jgi:cytochrome c oxidase assembly protein subunit 15
LQTLRDQPQSNDRTTQSTQRLALAFALLLGLTYLLIVLGALVRVQGAGLACPDWPLCFGMLIPAFDLKVAFEWTHRVVAGSVAIAFVVLAALTLRLPLRRQRLVVLLAIGAGLLALQILLGALTVWQLLASWTVTSHLLTGNAFAVTLAFVWRELSEAARPSIWTRRRSAPVPGVVRGLVSVTGALLVLQIALGGLVASTYTGLACPEWPTCMDGVWFPTFEGAVGLHLIHRVNGYALLAGLGMCAWAARGEPSLGSVLALAFWIGLAQVAAGVANVLYALPVEITGLHSALAAALVLTLALGLRAAWRSERQALPDGATPS